MAILDSILGVCSIMVDCFISSTSYAVAIGIYPENFTEKPNKDAVNIQIRFILLPFWINSAILSASQRVHGFLFRSVGIDSAVIHSCQDRTCLVGLTRWLALCVAFFGTLYPTTKWRFTTSQTQPSSLLHRCRRHCNGAGRMTTQCRFCFGREGFVFFLCLANSRC